MVVNNNKSQVLALPDSNKYTTISTCIYYIIVVDTCTNGSILVTGGDCVVKIIESELTAVHTLGKYYFNGYTGAWTGCI